METPAVTKERILLLRRGVTVLFAALAGVLIGTWQASSDGATSPLEVVKAQVKVKATNGFTIFEIRPELKKDEEGYIKVVGDAEYPLGNLTMLYQPKVKLEPAVVEPDTTLRSVTPEKPVVRAARTKRTSRRPIPPLPPANFLK